MEGTIWNRPPDLTDGYTPVGVVVTRMATQQSPKAFAKELRDEFRAAMEEAVEEYFTPRHFEEDLGGREGLIRTMFPDYAWRELFLGTLPTTRQLDLVYRQGDPYYDDRDIVVGLTKQLKDEIKHARIFSNYAAQFGAPADMTTWTPEHYASNVEMCRAATEYEAPHLVAAGFQCSTEIKAALEIRRMADYLEPVYPNMADTLRTVAADEGDHVHVGQLIIERFASPEDVPEMRRVAERKKEATLAHLRAKKA